MLCASHVVLHPSILHPSIPPSLLPLPSGDAKAGVSGHPLRLYLEYLAHLYRRMEPLTEQEKFEVKRESSGGWDEGGVSL